MKCVSRYMKYKDEDFDKVMMLIKSGHIKCGKYAHLVKIDKKKEMKGKEFFRNGSNKK